jgi:hypothetical protein
MQSVFQDMLSVHNAALMSSTPTSFDVTNPWDAVWKRVVEMKDWWTDEFERPAGLIRIKMMSLDAVLGGDVQIASTPHHSPSPAQPNNQPKNGGGKGTRNDKRKRNAGVPNKGKGSKGGNGAPANSAAASQLWCKICRSTDHDHLQCSQYDSNFGSNKGKGGKNGKNSKSKKAGK